jgi:hypothetical protein
MSMQSKMAQPEMLLTCIREVPASNLGWDTEYAYCGFFIFSILPGESPDDDQVEIVETCCDLTK